jgi:hypothetical protein
MLKPPFKITPVRTAADLAATIAIFRAYAASLDVDLAYQDFEGEMAAMSGKYARLPASCCWRVMLPAGPRAVSGSDRSTPRGAAK